MKNMLIISTSPREIITCGADARFQGILYAFSKQFNITWTFTGSIVTDNYFSSIKKIMLGEAKVSNELLSKYYGIVGPYRYEQVVSARLLKEFFLKKTYPNEPPDIVFLYYFIDSDLVHVLRLKFPKAKIVIDTNDIQYKRYAELAKARSIFNYVIKLMFLARHKKKELLSLKSADALVALSYSDENHLERINPNAKVLYCPTGIDTNRWKRRTLLDQTSIVGFYGAMDSISNEKAAIWFYKNCFPEIKRRIPDLKYHIIGSNPSRKLKLLHTGTDVIVTGFVEDPIFELQKLQCFVCPFQVSYGHRGRIYEVMSLGIPCVVTSHAVHGMGLEKCEGIIIVDRQNDFIETVIKILNDVKLAQKMGDANREWVKENVSIDVTYYRLATSLQNIC